MGDIPGYDAWKLATPPEYDQWDGADENGCTCPHAPSACGARMADKWCPRHGLDPDAEYEGEVE